jgi:hypothetical protein
MDWREDDFAAAAGALGVGVFEHEAGGESFTV